MVDYREVSPGVVEAAERFTLRPGDACAYHEGDIHCPVRAGETRLIRIEGINMDGIERRWFEPSD